MRTSLIALVEAVGSLRAMPERPLAGTSLKKSGGEPGGQGGGVDGGPVYGEEDGTWEDIKEVRQIAVTLAYPRPDMG